MSDQTETGHLDLIVCEGCGRRFATEDGAGMIAAITGPCPDCGGRFKLIQRLPEGAPASDPSSATTDISNEITLLYQRVFGRGPDQVRTYVEAEFAVCVLRDILAPAERSLLDRGLAATVETERGRAVGELDGDLLSLVEGRVGRPVSSHLARVNASAEVAIHIFLFEDRMEASDAARG